MSINRSKRVKILFIAVGILLLLAGLKQAFAWTPATRGGVNVFQKVPIEGMDQWILARGEDPDAPLLLWLHGGPGSAQMPIRRINRDLESHFIVVHWDQRGAGKSNPPGFDESTMTFAQYRQDVHEMTRYLKETFDRDKIYLLGHSWGTQIGLMAVRDYPEDYYAYIGVSQVVSEEGDTIGYEWLTERMRDREDTDGLEKLAALGEPPYRDHDDFVTYVNMLDDYGGGMDMGMSRLAWTALGATEYRLSDYLRWMDGANRGSGPMWDELCEFDARKQAPALDVPVYFLSGAQDYNTPLAMVDAYCEGLEDEEGKRLIVFDRSAHAPFLAEPEKFCKALLALKAETYR